MSTAREDVRIFLTDSSGDIAGGRAGLWIGRTEWTPEKIDRAAERIRVWLHERLPDPVRSDDA